MFPSRSAIEQEQNTHIHAKKSLMCDELTTGSSDKETRKKGVDIAHQIDDFYFDVNRDGCLPPDLFANCAN